MIKDIEMRAGLNAFTGVPLIRSEFATVPKIQISSDCPVTDEFRKKFNSYLEALFGREPGMFMVGEKIIAHPDIVEILMTEAAKECVRRTTIEDILGSGNKPRGLVCQN